MALKRPLSAVWLVHKPVGVTSFALVEEFRTRHAGPYRLKVMHGGVLDPFAQGLVVLLVGAATRLFERLHEVPKTYVATVAWGRETDTLDPHGAVVATGDPASLSEAQLEQALSSFLGWKDQVPPATSNKRVDGERAYAKAHRGEEVVLPSSRVYLHAARWRSHALSASSLLELTCGGGYYVRSLARDVGRLVGARAHLAALERTSLGPYVDPRGEAVSCTGREVLPWLPSRELTDAEVGALRRGQTLGAGKSRPPQWELPAGFPPPPPLTRAFHQGRLVALLQDGRAHTLLPGGV
ncbi:MAG: tRNA pseudouridine synthase B [Myxococcaceae bacterium]